MASRTRTNERYAAALGELWTGLTRTLGRLETVAGEPDRLDDDTTVLALRRLQYRLHVACEDAYGLLPPAGAEGAHADLAGALGAARDATAEVAEAAAFGGAAAVEPLVPEWRCALFAVRLARLELSGPRTPVEKPAAAPEHELARPLSAFLLALLGALAAVAGAALGLWPIWAGGLAAVAASLVAYRP
ncbi:MAG TPA: hypothetical protein VF186_03665 [Gaiellaceae bacterium]